MTDQEKTLSDALLMLDSISDYGGSPELMVKELMFNFGYTKVQAMKVYNDWLKVKA